MWSLRILTNLETSECYCYRIWKLRIRLACRNFDSVGCHCFDCHQYTLTDVATLFSDVTWISLVATWNINLYFSGCADVTTFATLGGELWSADRDPAGRRALTRTRLMTRGAVYGSDVIDQLSPVRVTASHRPRDLWPRHTSPPIHSPIVTYTLTGVAAVL